MPTINESWNELPNNVRDLILHGDNSEHLERSSKQPIMNNLSKKNAKGVYKRDLARKLWGYHADRTAKSYVDQFGPKDSPWHKVFTPSDRKAAAAHWEAMHHDQIKEAVLDDNGNMIFEAFEAVKTEETPYKKLFEAILDKKPLDVQSEFDALIKQKVADIVNEKKQALAEVVFLNDEQIEEKRNVHARRKKNKVADEAEDAAEYKKDSKKKEKPRSNAIHASIHKDDRTGSDD